MSAASLKQRLKSGETVYGASCSLGAPMIAEILASAGLDYVYVDQQHGLTSFDTLVTMLRCINRTPTAAIVRVLSNDAGLIGQALDAGADGVIVPMVNSREEAERAAVACRYAPLGVRSFGPMRAGLLHGRDPVAANGRVMCFVMIETAEGVAAADEITSVPGIDGIYIGQADLALSLGLEPLVKVQPGIHEQAVDRIRNACLANGITAGINGDAVAMAAQGYRMITLGSDLTLVNTGVARIMEGVTRARGERQDR